MQTDDGGEMSLLMVDDLPELICRRMPSVTHLLCTVDLHRLDGLQFPATLRALEVEISYPESSDDSDQEDDPDDEADDDQWHYLSVLLSYAVRLPLTKLRIFTEWPDASYPPVSVMEPLRRLADTITELELHVAVRGDDNDQWTADHFALFRSLPHLTRLDLSEVGLSEEELELLAANPPTQLQSLGLRSQTLSSRAVVAISRLSSLTELDVSLPWGAAPVDLSVIDRLTRLETLRLTVRCHLDTTQVMTALRKCTTITHLAFKDCDELTDAHLRSLLPSLTRLRRLQLDSPNTLDDLTCLSVASNLADTLEHLCIDHPARAAPHHALVHLRSLRRLQSAEISITSRCSSDIRDTSNTDSETVYLPMLEDLHIRISGDGDMDLYGMLGRLPQLRVVHLACKYDVAVPPLLQFLAHTPSLTALDWNHPDLTDAHLCSLMPSLPHLRDLTLGGLSLTNPRRDRHKNSHIVFSRDG